MNGLRATNEPASPSDERLLVGVATGDSEALEQLYDRYSRVVYGTALRMLGNPEHAEDIVQETFWRVWRRSGSFQQSRGQVASWIFGIAHNLCIDELRRQHARPQTSRSEDDQSAFLAAADERADVADVAFEAERRRLIRAALAQIPGEQRDVIELAYFGGLSQSEIAEHLQSPIGTVKTRIRLGLNKLREILLQRQLRVEDLTD
jgi:RNA polymerase sigma-70 factor (ECF subfamily)